MVWEREADFDFGLYAQTSDPAAGGNRDTSPPRLVIIAAKTKAADDLQTWEVKSRSSSFLAHNIDE